MHEQTRRGHDSWALSEYRSRMLTRVLEPEVMDTPAEASDYDAMDHSAVNATFCEDFLRFANMNGRRALGAEHGGVVDFGTGTAQIPIALAGRAAGFPIRAIDLAESMLAIAKKNVERAGLTERITLEKVDAKGTRFADGAFAATISNSIIHHIPEPEQTFAEMWRVTAKGGVLFVRDLFRPDTEAEIDRLVAQYGGDAPTGETERASFEHQMFLFRASFCAALTVAEVAAKVATLGIPASAVTMTSDRHWTLAYEKS